MVNPDQDPSTKQILNLCLVQSNQQSDCLVKASMLIFIWFIVFIFVFIFRQITRFTYIINRNPYLCETSFISRNLLLQTQLIQSKAILTHTNTHTHTHTHTHTLTHTHTHTLTHSVGEQCCKSYLSCVIVFLLLFNPKTISHFPFAQFTWELEVILDVSVDHVRLWSKTQSDSK